MSVEQAVLHFEGFELDLERFELRRDGAAITVQPRALELIAYLARHRERVVSRDELVEQVWKSHVVSDAALSRSLLKARAALGDDGEQQRILQTVHGRGFRFIARIAATPTPRATSERPALALSDDATPWVGRDDALGKLGGLLEQAAQGRGATWLVSGDGGIGKTRLLARAAALASTRGFGVLIGRCQELPGAPACWPWVQVIEGAWSALPESERAAFTPAIDPLLPGAAGVAALDVPSERFRMFDAVLRLLRRTSRDRPLLVVLDDLHHADAASLALTEWLSRETRTSALLLACSYRHGAQSQRAGQIAGSLLHGGTELLQLGGLSRDELSQWLALRTGSAPANELVSTMHARTAGNPLYLQQLWPIVRERGASASSALPATLRDAILARIDTGGGADHELLCVAAAVGETFTPARVASAADAGIEHVLPALDRALAAGVLARAEQRAGTLRFSHGLLREALYDSLPSEPRAEIHGRLAHALLEEGTSQSHVSHVSHLSHVSHERTAQIAHHALRAPYALRIREGIRFGIAASEGAFQRGAFDQSAEYCRATLEAMAACASPHPELDAVSMRLASALGRCGRLDEAAGAFRATRERITDQTRESLRSLDAAALHESLPHIDRQLPLVVTGMYERLFAAHPEARALFRRNRSDVQERMLVEALGSVLDHLEDAPWLTDTLLSLGARHVDYGVTDDMYEWIGSALLGALEAVLGDAWTPACARAWRDAYGAIATLMQRGAQLALKPSPAAAAERALHP